MPCLCVLSNLNSEHFFMARLWPDSPLTDSKIGEGEVSTTFSNLWRLHWTRVNYFMPHREQIQAHIYYVYKLHNIHVA